MGGNNIFLSSDDPLEYLVEPKHKSYSHGTYLGPSV